MSQLEIYSSSPAALQPLIERFTKRYGSFESEEYLRDERDYKVEAAQKARDRLARDTLRALIDQGRFEEAKTEIKRAYQGNNLLNQWDVRPIMDAPAEPLARRLYDLLYGGEQTSFDDRFEPGLKCWGGEVHAAGRRRPFT